MKLLARMKDWPQPLVLVVAFGVLGVIGWVDFVTGYQVSLGLFYFIPVVLFSWFLGRRAGYLMAVACCVLWLAIALHEDPNTTRGVMLWNAGMRLSSYVIVALLVDMTKQLGRRIEEMVADRTTALTAEVVERKRAEGAIHALTAQLSEAEDTERRRLAQDIHDTLGQTLTVLKMNLQNLGQGGAGEQADARVIAHSVALIETMIQQTRTLTFELYPAMLEHLGLIPTIRRHAEQFAGRMQISVTENGEPPTGVGGVAPHVSAYLFRAIKELINNAAKHGDAREVVIGFHWREAELRVVVDDDGAGFDAGRVMAGGIDVPVRGIGLASISERIASLGGKVCVESSPGNGARVILELPLVRVALPQESV